MVCLVTERDPCLRHLVLSSPRAALQVIERHPCLDKPDIGWDDPGWAVFMGFEHERIQ